MQVFSLLFPLFITLFLTSCQVKEGASSDLISGHKPATNSFVLTTPTTKTYVAGETLNLAVTFPFDIIKDNTGGEPRLKLTVGATTRYATFAAQPDPKSLQFAYTFVAAENDSDGVTVNALELNGSTLKFDHNGTIEDCVASSLASKTLSNVKVDTQAPSISGFSITNLPGMYNEGETIVFAMTFSENVFVTGTPNFLMNLSGSSKTVNYVSGSGSTVHLYAYTILAADSDTNGFNSITSPIALNGGTLKDAVGNDSSLNFSSYVAAAITYSNNVHVSGALPFIVNTIFPVNKTYVAAEDLDFILIFDRAVTVSGLPYLDVTIGSNVRQAQYVSGSGTEQITFRYTSVPGDVDPNGIDVATSIAQNSGNIVDAAAPGNSFFGDAFNNSYTHPATTGIILNAIQPQATAVARNLDSSPATWGTSVDNVWIPNQDLNITVSFNTNMYVNQTSGTPSIPITIGATTREAIYLSGGNGQTSLVFRYTIQDGDLDSDGTIALGNISLNGGVITDSQNTNTLLTLPVAGLSTTRIDGVKPTISSITPPANGTYSQVTPFDPSTMAFVVNWSEPVNYSSLVPNAAYLSMDVGGSPVKVDYSSGNQSAAVTHKPGTLVSTNDANGVSLTSPLAGSAVIKDQAGNQATVLTYSAPNTTNVLVDTTAPTVTSVTAITSNGTYKLGDTLSFSVTFSESVTTNVAGNYPCITITIGTTPRCLLPASNTTNTTHTFRYTIVSNEVDSDGVTLGTSIAHNGTTAYARDGGRNNSSGTFTAPNTTGIKVDSQIPTISTTTVKVNGSTITAPYGTWEVGDVLTVTANYSENMTVSGTPRLALTIAGNSRYLNYSSGSGSQNIVFTYTFNSDFDTDGLSSITSIDLNGGTILDSGSNATATQNLPAAVNLASMNVLVPGVRLWVQKEYVSLARSGSPSVSNSGVVTSIACGLGLCREADGDDALTLGGALNNVNTVFIVLRTPQVLGVSHNMFGTAIQLSASGTYDLITSTRATVLRNGGAVATSDGGFTHQMNRSAGSTAGSVVEVTFNANQSFGVGNLIPVAFDGRIGEIIVVTGSPSAADLTTIRNYLNNKY